MKNEALNNGYDDAIALDEAGHVTESSISNIFIVRHGRLITPSSHHDVLEGITLNTVMTIARSLDIAREFSTIDRSELYIADEAFLTGSSIQIVPVTSIDKRSLNASKPGPITIRISKEYQKITHGLAPDHHHWLTKV
jgi:branched-chain amino acid aminotransferase